MLAQNDTQLAVDILVRSDYLQQFTAGGSPDKVGTSL